MKSTQLSGFCTGLYLRLISGRVREHQSTGAPFINNTSVCLPYHPQRQQTTDTWQAYMCLLLMYSVSLPLLPPPSRQQTPYTFRPSNFKQHDKSVVMIRLQSKLKLIVKGYNENIFGRIFRVQYRLHWSVLSVNCTIKSK